MRVRFIRGYQKELAARERLQRADEAQRAERKQHVERFVVLEVAGIYGIPEIGLVDEVVQNGVLEVRVHVGDGLVRPLQLHAADYVDVSRRDAGHERDEEERAYFGSARILMQPSLTVPLFILILCSRRPLKT